MVGVLKTRNNHSLGCLETSGCNVGEEMAIRGSWRGRNFDLGLLPSRDMGSFPPVDSIERQEK
jgi:hypothetical protein